MLKIRYIVRRREISGRRHIVLFCAALACALALLTALTATAGAAGRPSFDAHGSVEQVYATGLKPGAKLTLFDRRGRKVATRKADSLGAVLFRHLLPGGRYHVRLA